jgi:type I restriction enzyme S subunit
MSVAPYPKYKDSGVEWIGKVPDSWHCLSARRLFKQIREEALVADEQLSATQKYGVIPQRLFMEIEDQKIVLALSGTGNFRHVEPNDFVISLRSFQGGIERSLHRGCVSPAYTVLRARHDLVSAYWAFLFKSGSFVGALQSVTEGIRDGKTVSYDQFSTIDLPIPPLAEQSVIAAFLDQETGKIDALVVEQESLIALLKEKRQAVISKAVTKGLNPNAPMKDSGIEWLGQVPAHWEVTRLKYAALRDGTGIQIGPFGGMLKDLPDAQTGFKLYGQQNIISGDFEAGDRWITEDTFLSNPVYQIREGDLLVTRKGSLGNCRPVPANATPGWFDSDSICVRVELARAAGAYIELLLHEAEYVAMQIGQTRRGAILSGINTEVLSNLVIVLPPLAGC